MREPELDQFMSPEVQYYIHKDGLFPRYGEESSVTFQGEGSRFCLQVVDGVANLLYEDGYSKIAPVSVNWIKACEEDGIWVQTKNPFKTDHETIVEFLKSITSEVAAKGIIEWMKTDSCSSGDFHEIRSFAE